MFATVIRSTVSLVVATAATILIVAGSAAPASAETAPTATVSVAGIDLTSQAGNACQMIKMIAEVFASQGTATLSGAALSLLL